MFAKQSIGITGFGSAKFSEAIGECQKIVNLFEQSFPIGSLESWTPSYLPGSRHEILEVSNRFFIKKNSCQVEDIIELKKDIDPKGILKKTAGSDYVYTMENSVSYFQCVVDEEETAR